MVLCTNFRSKSAQAVKDIVTPENFGMRYSNKDFGGSYVNDEANEYFRVASYIGGDSNAMPKYQKYAWIDKIGGWATVSECP